MAEGNSAMKTRLIFPNSVICLIYLTLFLACTFVPTFISSNLAPNPSFEAGRDGSVSGWSGSLDGTTFTWSEDMAYSGRRSVCISNLRAEGSTEWNSSKSIPVSPGETYTFSAYAKGDFDREAYIAVNPTDADGRRMDGYMTFTPFNNTDWTYAEVSFTTPPKAVAVQFHLGANNQSDTETTGIICYDDVSFR
jgi:hypothetical protein